MTPDYPDDADGDALRRVARAGSDMTQPMLIDYHVAVQDRISADQIALAALRLGYATKVVAEERPREFTVWCTRGMVPDYDSIIAAQRELDTLAAPFGGKTDGWGTY